MPSGTWFYSTCRVPAISSRRRWLVFAQVFDRAQSFMEMKGFSMAGRLFTSESVTEGHPDKMSDQVSDAILDAMLSDDPESRVAVETLFTTGLVVVAGEVTTSTWVDIPAIVRKTSVTSAVVSTNPAIAPLGASLRLNS